MPFFQYDAKICRNKPRFFVFFFLLLNQKPVMCFCLHVSKDRAVCYFSFLYRTQPSCYLSSSKLLSQWLESTCVTDFSWTAMGLFMCNAFPQLLGFQSNLVAKIEILFTVPLALMCTKNCLPASEMLLLFCFQSKFMLSTADGYFLCVGFNWTNCGFDFYNAYEF